MNATAPPEGYVPFEDALFRQRERTIDNIKRIYAVVYSISFTNILLQIVQYSTRWLLAGESWLGKVANVKAFAAGFQLRLLMLLIFTSTVSVFAYQADKFLDLRYALRPPDGQQQFMPRWHKWDFAIDATSLILTLVPFALMSYAFTVDLVDRYGIIPFFAGYLLLLGLSVALLLLVRLKYVVSRCGQVRLARDPNGQLPEETRYAALSVHWFVTNGFIGFVLTLVFLWAGHSGTRCAMAMYGRPAWFVGTFVILALLRNIVDFRVVWPFLHVNERTLTRADLTWLMRRVVVSPLENGPTRWDLSGFLSVLVFSVAALVVFPTLSPHVCLQP